MSDIGIYTKYNDEIVEVLKPNADERITALQSGTMTISGTKTFSSDITGNISTANKLKTPVTITIKDSNDTTGTSISFDGSSNIVVPLPTTIKATTFTGNLTGNVTGNVTGNCSGTSTSLATARTISLAGDVSGSTSFNGSSDVSITATVADNSHNHTIANVTNLQSSLNGKANSSHSHSIGEVSDLWNQLNNKANSSWVTSLGYVTINGVFPNYSSVWGVGLNANYTASTNGFVALNVGYSWWGAGITFVCGNFSCNVHTRNLSEYAAMCFPIKTGTTFACNTSGDGTFWAKFLPV